MEDSYGEIGMDVNAGHNDFFERALRPNAVKDLTNNWNDLVGYVYCVSKSFNPYSDHTNKKLNKELHLVKIGMGSLRGESGSFKGLSRVFGLRTASISLFINTLWLFKRDTTQGAKRNTDQYEAYQAEKSLHDIIMAKWEPKPEIFRIHFRSGHKDGVQGRESEWFHIEKKRLKEFCDFCHEQMFHHVEPDPLHAIGFARDDTYNIKKIPVQKTIGVRVLKDGTITQKEEPRPVSRRSARLARTVDQRKQRKINMIRDIEKARRREEQKDEMWDGKKHDAKWLKVFKGQRFRDAKMWGGKTDKYPDKVFTGVYRFGKVRNRLLVEYVPYFPKTRDGQRKLEAVKDTDEYDDSTGSLTVNEALLELFDVKGKTFRSKFEDKYQYYVDKHGWQEKIEYAAEAA